MLDFSRLAAGQLTLRLSLVDLVRLVQETAEQMRPWSVRQGIDLQIIIKE